MPFFLFILYLHIEVSFIAKIGDNSVKKWKHSLEFLIDIPKILEKLVQWLRTQ